jgi:DNA-binding MarR family transcriptional regulator
LRETFYPLKPEETIDYHLKSTWQAVSRMYNEVASAYGGTMATGYVLLNIDAEGTPSTSLGPRMGMESTSLSRTLKSMEDKGLIERQRHEEDGRIVLIKLTDFGREKRELAREAVINFNRSVQDIVPEEDLKGFFKTTRLIQAFIESQKKNKSSS